MNNDHLTKTETEFKNPVDFGEHFIEIEREHFRITQVQDVFT